MKEVVACCLSLFQRLLPVADYNLAYNLSTSSAASAILPRTTSSRRANSESLVNVHRLLSSSAQVRQCDSLARPTCGRGPLDQPTAGNNADNRLQHLLDNDGNSIPLLTKWRTVFSFASYDLLSKALLFHNSDVSGNKRTK